jgi:hypothetical protein
MDDWLGFADRASLCVLNTAATSSQWKNCEGARAALPASAERSSMVLWLLIGGSATKCLKHQPIKL